MKNKKQFFVVLIFILPLVFGLSIVGYWFWTTRVEKNTLLPSYGSVPEFSLTAETDCAVTRDNLLGKISIVDFIFTQCAGACPVMSSKMSGMQQMLLNDPHIQFVSFSVDPETDTPGVLRQYARQYGAITGKWILLTGNKQQIYRLSKEGFHLGLDIEGDSAIIHSQKFVLVDHHGVIRGYYDSEDEEAMKTLLRDAGVLSAKASP